MITLTVGTAQTLLAIFVTISGAQLAFVWRAGVKLGEFSEAILSLTEAVKGLSKLPERVLVLEIKESAREKREKRHVSES